MSENADNPDAPPGEAAPNILDAATTVSAMGLMLAFAFGLATMAKDVLAGVLILGAIAVAAALIYIAHRRGLGWVRRFCYAGVALLLIVSIALVFIGDERAAEATDKAMRSAMKSAPTGPSTPFTYPPTTTAFATTAATTTRPEPESPPLPEEKLNVYELKTTEFFGGALVLAGQHFWSSYITLTITRGEHSCTEHLDPGERVTLKGSDADNRYFQLTLLEFEPNQKYATISAVDLPPEKWPSRTSGCL